MVNNKVGEIERLPLTDDYIFKRVFAFEGNESVLKDLLEAILRRDIKEVIFIANYNFLKRNSYHSVGKVKFEKTLPEEYVDMGYKEEDEIASKYIEFHYI